MLFRSTPYDFREMLQASGNGLGMVYQHIDNNKEYAEVIKKIQEPKDVSKEFIGDIAYDEFVSKVYSNEFEDEYGIFDYNAYNAFRDEIRAKYGEDVYQYILEKENQKRADLPPLAQEYYKAREILRPYWQVRDEAIRIFGEPKTKWAELRLDAFVSRTRERLRRSNRDIAYYYNLFYVKT